MKLKFIFAAFIFLFFASQVQAGADLSVDHIDLPRDAEGWTVFSPSSDSRIIYISETGDDNTGQFYSPSDPEIGAYAMNPIGEVNAFRTFAAAHAQARSGYPDWILFKRGEVFEDSLDQVKSGRSRTEPILFSSYGSSGDMPLIKAGSDFGIRLWKRVSFMAVAGLDFYAHTRDFDSPDFTSTDGAVGLSFYSQGADNRAILVEGCKFRFFQSNISLVVADDSTLAGVNIRRNLVLNSYSDGSNGQGHSQGMWSDDTVNLILEENIFDHNGWYKQRDFEAYPDSGNADGQATMFNHNTYMGNLNSATFQNNIFLRSSSIHNKFTSSISSADIDILNNLYVDGEFVISMGFNYRGLYRFNDINIRGNVSTNVGLSRPTNRALGWGFQISGWSDGVIEDNYILHQKSPDVSNVYGIELRDVMRNLEIRNNVFANLDRADGFFLHESNAGSTNINVYDNLIQYGGAETAQYSKFVISSEYSPIDVNFSSNKYFSDLPSDYIFKNGSTHMNMEAWQTDTGDNSTFEEVSFHDSSRGIETYQSHIGETATIEAFIENARNMGRYNWDTRYTAVSVSDWIKEGFQVAGDVVVIRGDVNQDSSINSSDALLVLRRALSRSMTGTDWRSSSTTGDVNCDGSVNTVDALLTLREHLGLDNSGSGWCGG